MDEKQYVIKLYKCTGLLIYGSHRTYEMQGTYEQLVAEYKKVQRHNKIWGWWFGLMPFTNRRYIKANKQSLQALQALRSQSGLSV